MDLKPQITYKPKENSPWSAEENALIANALESLPIGTPLDVRTVVPRLANYPKPIMVAKQIGNIADLRDQDGRLHFRDSNDFGYKLMGELAKEKNRWHSIPNGNFMLTFP